MAVAIKEMLDYLGDFTDRMTSWERAFIESVTDQFDRRGTLSPAQLETLEKIYGKH